MGDFLLDLRPAARRKVKCIADKFRFLPHIRVVLFEKQDFDLAVALPEEPEVWQPFAHPDGSRLVALAGRVVVDQVEWDAASRNPHPGGIACKALDSIYAKSGISGLEQLSGNFALIVHDRTAACLHLVTDCSGAFPAFDFSQGDSLLFGSHPDILAAAAGEHENLDETSLAEFALTGTVSPPYTYYRRIRAVGRAMTVTVDLRPQGARKVHRRCYFPLRFLGEPADRQEQLAEELAVAFRNAVASRSRPAYGRCAVALSGGMDSRAVLASVDAPSNAFAFTCYDQENNEFRIARAIARGAGVEFFPRQRSFEYYGDNAENGMRISGGMGTIANNHFLGVIPWLRELGAKVLLTGCYCDYLFKALPLNRRTDPITGRERLAPYKREFYFNHFWPKSALADEVLARLDARFPADITASDSDAGVFELEQRRTFPLCYEADNAQRLVPQRLMGWFVPISDPALMKLYCRIPYRWKLNRSIFRKAVRRISGANLSAIPDANTGAPLKASVPREALSWTLLRLRGRLQRFTSSLATTGSWPNWHHYLTHSRRLAGLWARPNAVADALFPRVLGRNHLSPDVGSYQGNDRWLLVQLLSLKLWLEQRLA
jgi:asparagine synthase (glutamine-hydrolysing)